MGERDSEMSNIIKEFYRIIDELKTKRVPKDLISELNTQVEAVVKWAHTSTLKIMELDMRKSSEETLLEFKEEIKQMIDERLDSRRDREVDDQRNNDKKKNSEKRSRANDLIIRPVDKDVDVYDELNAELQPQDIENSRPTFSSACGDGYTDLVLCSPNSLIENFDMQILEENSLSDHNYILISIKDVSIKDKRDIILSNNVKRIDRCCVKMRRFIFEIEDRIVNTKDAGEFNDLILYMEKRIEERMRRDLKCEIRQRSGTAWWNYELNTLRRRVRAIRKSCQVKGDFRNRAFIQDKEYYEGIFKVATNKIKKQIILRDSDNRAATDVKEEYLKIVKKTLNIETDEIDDPDNNGDNFGNDDLDGELDFTYEEIREVILSLRDRAAPGLDGIRARVVKRLFVNYPSFFIILFNKCLSLHVFPIAWKIGRLILLPKNEDKYRPICLLKVFAKVLDKLIVNRLLYVINDKQHLAENQYGFRKRRSANLALFRVVDKIRRIKSIEHVAVVSFDVKAAFDSVRWSSVLNKLFELKITKDLYLLIRDYFSNRRIVFKGFSEDLDINLDMFKGCPQGSCSAPLFWALIVNTLLVDFDVSNAEIICYADDILLIIKGSSLEKIQHTFIKVEEQMLKWE
ncbi:uncharacterized protein LOC118196979 [Stegodyphus dumicola]|uniref:uncharacterized protein LOC118196979 n=1 Tax=Stegodyphus dumicola TaxID=202533 RepID=UPI0015AC4537|nr:uncharacterized protein LOC118196979 [Stegodyphus dumicola]